MKKVVLFFALIVGLLASATTQAQTVNMSRYITLTVAKDSAIKLNFKAATNGTPVRIVSGSNTQNITVGVNKYGTASYTADGTTMTVYGDLIGFDCYQNGANLTALDPSHNTQLKNLDCSSNNLTTLDVSNNTQLTTLSCYSNTLNSLNVSGCTQLTTLWCGNNNLSSLDVSHNTQLYDLKCFSNSLTTLDLSHNTRLYILDCYSNTLTSLNVSGCTQLNSLDCYSNTLTSLNVSGCTQLNSLYCYSNTLNSLNVSGCTQLKTLWCNNNNLSSLDVSHNTQLQTLNCHSNNFSTQAIDDIYCSLPRRHAFLENAVIYPIYQSTSTDYATVLATNKQNAISKNWKVRYYADNTNIPATTGIYVCGTPHPQPNMSRYITLTVTNGAAIKLNFKAASAGTPIRIVSGSNTQDITVGTNWYDSISPNTYTVTANASTMTIYGDITVFNCVRNGANLTALDLSHNTQLNYLSCSNNNLTTLDVSGCTQLISLSCNNNNLTALDLSHNTQLNYLSCFDNNLTTLDVSGCTQLISLSCYNNNLTTLDVSGYTQLIQLFCNDNNLTTLDVSRCTQLNSLECNNNNLTALDLSHNTQLNSLECNNNNLTAIDLSHNTQLNSLDCSNNNLTTLDLSHNTQLSSLDCSNNNLTTLDVSVCTQLSILSCQSNNFSTAALDDLYCSLPDLTGITSGHIFPLNNASDPNHATVLATNKQNAILKSWNVQYAENYTDIPATTGTYTCPQLNMDSYITLTVAKDSAIKLDFKAAAAATPIRIVSGSNTQDITVGTSWKGITSYTAADSVMTVYGDIIVFDCSRNGADLTAIDLSHHTQLTELYCTNNKITSLDVSNNTQLTGLYCTSNQLSSLNASGCTQLKTLNCVSNQLLSLNVSGCTQLTKVECFSNRLSSLDVSGYTQLKELNCYGNQLSNINVSGCTQLKELKCYNNQLASLNISGCTQLKELYCYNNILTALDVSGCTQLKKVYCHDNKLSTDALDDIYCALPDRKDSINGVIQPVDNSSSTYNDTVIASNAANATAKNWKVQYYSNDADIATTGTYECSTTTDISEASAEPVLTLYPNPVADVLYLSATARTVRIYNIYGIEVAHAADTDRVEVSHLSAGVYTVRADGTVAKMVKR